MSIIKSLSPVMLLLVAVAGCQGPGHNLAGERFAPHAPMVATRDGDRRPALTVSEVRRIAGDAAETAGCRLEEYADVLVVYGSLGDAGQWTVTFTKRPPVPDDCLIVVVDDRNGAVKWVKPLAPR